MSNSYTTIEYPEEDMVVIEKDYLSDASVISHETILKTRSFSFVDYHNINTDEVDVIEGTCPAIPTF